MRRGIALKWINNIIMTVLVIIICIIAFNVVSANTSGQEPSVFGYQIKTVLSGSMEPEFQTGSVIIIEEINNDLLEVGDVITFLTKENILVTHRIVETTGNEYITKGDNNNGIDINPVISQNIIGKYTGLTIPYVGYVVFFVSTKLGSALFLILPSLYLIGYSLIIMGRSFKDKKSTENKTQSEDDK